LNLPYFISKRINATKEGSFSSTINRIAIASVALGVAIMIGSFMILGGFQNNIKDKIFSFSGHIQIKKFTLSSSFEEPPIVVDEERMASILEEPLVEHVQEYAHKPGLISVDGEVFGLLFKGVSNTFDRSAFDDYLLEGEIPEFSDSLKASNQVAISERMSKRMKVGLGDRIVSYFNMEPPRTRSFIISGIYSTGLDSFDEQMAIGDIRVIRTLNEWDDNQVGGYEVFISDIDKLAEADDNIIQKVSVEQTTERADEKFLQIFDWLNLLSQNVYILIGIILFVACFNMVSVLFILIMERTSMIGSFKAFGAKNKLIRKIFAYNGLRLVLRGLLIGNLIAIGFGAIQYYFKLIPLNPKTYYMSHVPINWDWTITLGINVLTLVIVGLVLILPTVLISRINPVKAIRFD